MPPHFSPAVSVGDLVFVSGQFGVDARGETKGDCAEQTTAALSAMVRILETNGLAARHVVKTTVWLRHGDDFAAFNAAYAGFFGDHRPARATVVAELTRPGALVEVECVASRALGSPT